MTQLTWGIVRGRKIHLACATDDEILMAWSEFGNPTTDPRASEPCSRCGKPLAEDPE